MRSGEASRTAQFMALFRALESCRRPAARRVVEDPLAAAFLPPALRAVAIAARLPGVAPLIVDFIDRRWPGARSSGVARTRWIDDAVRDALRAGTSQLVILGAGFDARAYRLPGIERMRVFEVDHPATQQAKRDRLRAALGALPVHVTFVAVDFDRQSLAEAMTAAGFDPRAHTFVIWEGVTNYLTSAGVDATLRWVHDGTAPGTRIVFSYVHRGVLDGSTPFSGTERLTATLGRAGERWTFGLDPGELPRFLADRGFTLLADVGAADYRARYAPGTGAAATGYEFYRLALAETVAAEPV